MTDTAASWRAPWKRLDPELRATIKRRWPVFRFVFYLAFIAFIVGVVLGMRGIQPTGMIRMTEYNVVDLATYWKNDFGIEPTRHLVDAEPGREAISVIDPARAAGGNRFISGLTPFREAPNGALLLDRDGAVLHYWPVDYGNIDRGGRRSTNVFLHGIVVFPDGSIIVTFDSGSVISRIGPCGDTIWVTRGLFHHVVSKSYDGSIWTWERDPRTLRHQFLVQLDPDTGEVLRRISLRRDVIEPNGLEGIFGLRMNDAAESSTYIDDPFHPNDLDILSPALAGAFPGFSAGDILISLRSINLVAVLDGETYDAKWWQHGPWFRQHDPDFLPDGTISIYNNNMHLRDSEIVRIDPATGSYEVVFASSEQTPFYTWMRGKHQTLANGNILITEPQRGRVFEIDADGKLVWEYNNIYDETRNGVLNKAILLPEDFFEQGALDCTAEAG